jgi:hypothetical protein
MIEFRCEGILATARLNLLMNYVRLEFPLLYFVGILVLINFVALTVLIYKRRKKSAEPVLNSAKTIALSDRGRMTVVIEQLRDGGYLDASYLRRMSPEDKALFEVQLIDALTKWPREDQHQLRSALIKHGYDEQCARRVMRESISDRVRASTLLSLLRPQSQARTGDLAQRPKAETAKPTGPENSEGTAVTKEKAKEKSQEL